MTATGATKQDLSFYDPDLEDEDEDDLDVEEEDHRLDHSGERTSHFCFIYTGFWEDYRFTSNFLVLNCILCHSVAVI